VGWSELDAQVVDVDGVGAKLWLAELGNQRGLTEMEQAWLVRSLYREDRLTQPEIAVRLGRHMSWVWRRLRLAEALHPAVQSEVRLGLLAPRSAVELSRLPRGNQESAARVVIGEGLTVSQTERLEHAVLECSTAQAGHELLERFARGQHPFTVTPRRGPCLGDADPLLRDVGRVRQMAGRMAFPYRVALARGVSAPAPVRSRPRSAPRPNLSLSAGRTPRAFDLGLPRPSLFCDIAGTRAVDVRRQRALVGGGGP
jgi:hypothetical protein